MWVPRACAKHALNHTKERKNTLTVIKARDKWDAAYDLLNLLLKDNEKYCNMCGATWKNKPCCESPQIGTNYEHLQAVVKQNKTKIQINENACGTNKSNTMRSAISMPPVLYQEWCKAFETLYGEKLFKTPSDLHTCMKRMPFLCTCERV